MGGQLLNQIEPSAPLKTVSRKKPSRNNPLSPLEALDGLAQRREKIEREITEYYGYTPSEILREWQERFPSSGSFGREFHLNEVGRLMRSIAEMREVQEVLENDILKPLVQKNILYSRAVSIIVKVGDSQDTQKTLLEEIGTLLERVNKTTNTDGIDSLQEEAVTLFKELDQEVERFNNLQKQMGSINIPCIVSGVSDEINKAP